MMWWMWVLLVSYVVGAVLFGRFFYTQTAGDAAYTPYKVFYFVTGAVAVLLWPVMVAIMGITAIVDTHNAKVGKTIPLGLSGEARVEAEARHKAYWDKKRKS